MSRTVKVLVKDVLIQAGGYLDPSIPPETEREKALEVYLNTLPESYFRVEERP